MTVILPSATRSDGAGKVSPQVARFRVAAEGEPTCHTCVHRVGGHCELVDTVVRRDTTCDLYEGTRNWAEWDAEHRIGHHEGVELTGPGWHKGAADATAEGISAVHRAFPRGPRINRVWHNPEQVATGNKSINSISVNSQFLDDAAIARREHELRGVLVRGSEGRKGVIVHEYGHVLDTHLGRTHPALARKLDACLHEHVTWADGSKHERVKSGLDAPSAYGSENRYEFVAEALADHVLNGEAAHPSSKAVAAIFHEAYGAADGERSWLKWDLEHPYQKKGHKHHAPDDDPKHYPGEEKLAADLAEAKAPKLPSEDERALQKAITEQGVGHVDPHAVHAMHLRIAVPSTTDLHRAESRALTGDAPEEGGKIELPLSSFTARKPGASKVVLHVNPGAWATALDNGHEDHLVGGRFRINSVVHEGAETHLHLSQEYDVEVPHKTPGTATYHAERGAIDPLHVTAPGPGEKVDPFFAHQPPPGSHTSKGRVLPEVGHTWGHDRTAEYLGRDLHAEGVWPGDPKKARYGSVIFDSQGRVMLREPKSHFAGYSWTFPKGGGDPGEHPVESARRETIEEIGRNGTIVGHVPGSFEGGSSVNNYYLMHLDESEHPDWLNGETARVAWATPQEAEELIKQTTNATGRERDLWALHAAVAEHARLYPDVSTPMAPRTELTITPSVALPSNLPGHVLGPDGLRRHAPDVLWHIAPSENRKQIEKEGLPTGATTLIDRKAADKALAEHKAQGQKMDLWSIKSHGLTFHEAGDGLLHTPEPVPHGQVRVNATTDKARPVWTPPPVKPYSWETPEKSALLNAMGHVLVPGGSVTKPKPKSQKSQAMLDAWKGGWTSELIELSIRGEAIEVSVHDFGIQAIATRDWKKWHLEHPYLRKGRHHKGWTAEDHKVIRDAKVKAKKLPKGRMFTAKRAPTDEEFSAHRNHVEHVLQTHGSSDLLRSPFSTHISEDRWGGVEGAYKPQREAMHRRIIDEIMANASEVPNEKRAIVTGGLGGAGKSTVLRHNAAHPDSVAHKVGIRYANYDEHGNGVGDPISHLTLNPDAIKERMAELGMIPKVKGLSPMEASTFIHEESSKVAEDLGRRAQAEGKNVIWDVTLNSQRSGDKRIAPMRALTDAEHPNGYHVHGVFVDVSPEHSVQNAYSRHRHGMEKYASGEGYGGRYVPSDLILGAHDPEGVYRSKNRSAFEALKSRGAFDHTITIDNEGNAGRVVDETSHTPALAGARADGDAPFPLPHGPITLAILAYRNGQMDWPDLLDHLATTDYAAPSYYGTPDATEDDVEDVDRYEPGTWGEVRQANLAGLLSDPEYASILQAIGDDEDPGGTTGERADVPTGPFGHKKLSNWYKWNLEHPYVKKGRHHDADVDAPHGAAYWKHLAEQFAKDNADAHTAKTHTPMLPEGHYSAYAEGHSLTHEVGVKLAIEGQDSKQISDRAAPLYAAAKKAKDSGDLQQHAQLLGAAHGFKQASKEQASWEKEHGLTPHSDVAGGKGLKHGAVHASVTTPITIATTPGVPTVLAKDVQPGDLVSGHSTYGAKFGPMQVTTSNSAGETTTLTGTIDGEAEPWTIDVQSHQPMEHHGYEAPPIHPALTDDPIYKDGYEKGYQHAKTLLGAGADLAHVQGQVPSDEALSINGKGFKAGMLAAIADHAATAPNMPGIGPHGETSGILASEVKPGDVIHAPGTGAFVVTGTEKSGPNVTFHGVPKGQQGGTTTKVGPYTAESQLWHGGKANGEHGSPYPIGSADDEYFQLGYHDTLSFIPPGITVAQATEGHKHFSDIAHGKAPNSLLHEAAAAGKAAAYRDKLTALQAAAPSEATAGFQIQSKYLEGSPKHATFMQAHDEALQYAQGVSMTPAVAKIQQQNTENAAKTMPPGTGKAAVEGTAAGYAHHAYNVEHPESTFVTPDQPTGPDSIPVSNLIAGATLPGGYKVEANVYGTDDTMHVKLSKDGEMLPSIHIASHATAAGLIAMAEANKAHPQGSMVNLHTDSVASLATGDVLPGGYLVTAAAQSNAMQSAITVEKNGESVDGVYSGDEKAVNVIRQWHLAYGSGPMPVESLKAGDTFAGGLTVHNVEHTPGEPLPFRVTLSQYGGKPSATYHKAGETINDVEAMHKVALHAGVMPGAPPGGWSEADKVTPSVSTPHSQGPKPTVEKVTMAKLHTGDKVWAYNSANQTFGVHTVGTHGKDLSGKYATELLSDEGHPSVHWEGFAGNSKVEKVVPPSSGLSDHVKLSHLQVNDTLPSGHKITALTPVMAGANVYVTLEKDGEETTIKHPADASVNDVVAKHEAQKLVGGTFPPGTYAQSQAAPAPESAGNVPASEAALGTMTKLFPGSIASNGETVPPLSYHSGQWYDDGNGHLYLFKTAKSDEQAMAEVAGSIAFRQAGINAQKVTLVKMNDGHLGTLSHFVPATSVVTPGNVTPVDQATIRKGFGMDALLSHHDVFGEPGNSKGNLLRDGFGDIIRIDFGGSGGFKGDGSLKPEAQWTPGDWTALATGSENKATYATMTSSTQGKLAYGTSDISDLSKPDLVQSLKDAANFDVNKYRQALTTAGITHGFAYDQVEVIAKRQEHLKNTVLPMLSSAEAPADNEAPLTPSTSNVVIKVGDAELTPYQATKLKQAMEEDLDTEGAPLHYLGWYMPKAGLSKISPEFGQMAAWKDAAKEAQGVDGEKLLLDHLTEQLAAGGSPSTPHEPTVRTGPEVTVGPVTMTHAQAQAVKAAMEAEGGLHGNPINVTQVYLDNAGVPFDYQAVAYYKYGLPLSGNADSDKLFLNKLNEALGGATSTGATTTTGPPPKKTFTAVMAKNLKPGDVIKHPGGGYLQVTGKAKLSAHVSSDGTIGMTIPGKLVFSDGTVGLDGLDTEALVPNGEHKMSKLSSIHPVMKKMGGSVQSSTTTPLPGSPAASVVVPSFTHVTAPADFIETWQQADKLTNLGKHEAMPQKALLTESELKALQPYDAAKNLAQQVGQDLAAEQAADRAQAALERHSGAISPAEQAAFLGLHHGFNIVANEKQHETLASGESSADLRSSPAYAQAEAEAQQWVATGKDSHELYAKAQTYKEASTKTAEGDAQWLAWHHAAQALDQQENEKPLVDVTGGHAPLTDEQVAHMVEAAKPKEASNASAIQRWAYDRGRAIGINVGNASADNGLTVSDIENKALEQEQLGQSAPSDLLRRTHQGIAKGLHRVAANMHAGNSHKKDDGTYVITTSKTETLEKPKWFTPSAGGSSTWSGFAHVTLKPTAEEKAAIGEWTGDYRFGTQSQFIKAVNTLMEGKDPGDSASAAQAKLFMRLCALKSTISQQTIYRGTDGGEFHSGQLQKWKDAIAAGGTVDFSMPVASSTYNSGVWSGRKYRYVIEPGAMTADIGQFGYHEGEIETVTGGLMEVYKIEPSGGTTYIYMRQKVHYVV